VPRFVQRVLTPVVVTVLALAALAAGGCSSQPPRSPQTAFALDVLGAIHRNDWATFEVLATTRADITIQRLGLSNLQAKQGYLGGVMRPEEWQRWREVFDRARQYDALAALIEHPDRLDVILLERGREELILGGEFDYEVCSLTTTPEKSDHIPESVPILLMLVPDTRGYKLLGLELGSGSASGQSTGGTI